MKSDQITVGKEGHIFFYSDITVSQRGVVRPTVDLIHWNSFHRCNDMDALRASVFGQNRPGIHPGFLPVGKPAWLPIMQLCREADPEEGGKFAASILEAETEHRRLSIPVPGRTSYLTSFFSRKPAPIKLKNVDSSIHDDAPAAIAVDWLESLGKIGYLCAPIKINLHVFNLLIKLGWERRDKHSRIYFSGRVSDWCRLVMEHYCLLCGGLKDGSDTPEAIMKENKRGDYAQGTRRKPPKVVPRKDLNNQGWAHCPMCGHVAHYEPPDLTVPTLSPPGPPDPPSTSNIVR